MLPATAKNMVKEVTKYLTLYVYSPKSSFIFELFLPQSLRRPFWILVKLNVLASLFGLTCTH